MKKFLCLITLLFMVLCVYADGYSIDFSVEDDIIDCVVPGDLITYTISYEVFGGPLNPPEPQFAQITCTWDTRVFFDSATGSPPPATTTTQATWSFDSRFPFTETLTCEVGHNIMDNDILVLEATDENSEIGYNQTLYEYTDVCFGWEPGSLDLKWSQYLDLAGYDINATAPLILADDWECTENSKILGLKFWGSWLYDEIETIDFFHLSIYADIPATQEPGSYSKPGELLWSFDAIDYVYQEFGDTPQGWCEPNDYYAQYPPPEQNHSNYYEYLIEIPFDAAYTQEGSLNDPIIYWLAISAYGNLPNAGFYSPPAWGWKNSFIHWNDTAVWSMDGTTWTEIKFLYIYNREIGPVGLAFELYSLAEDILPVELSSFTGIFNSDLYSSTLSWTTQSESANMGWNIYRALSGNLNEALRLNAEMIAGAGNSSEPVSYQYDDVTDLENDSDYWYWLESVDSSGGTQPFGPIIVSTLLQEEDPDPPPLADQYGLWQNYPNPFNPDTEISFILEKDGECELVIYDTKGGLVKILFQGFVEAEQNYSFIWRGRDYNDKEVTSGIYFYKIKSGRYSSTRKMILLK